MAQVFVNDKYIGETNDLILNASSVEPEDTRPELKELADAFVGMTSREFSPVEGSITLNEVELPRPRQLGKHFKSIRIGSTTYEYPKGGTTQ